MLTNAVFALFKIQTILSPTHLLPAHHTTTSSLSVKCIKTPPQKAHIHSQNIWTHKYIPTLCPAAFSSADSQQWRETERGGERERDKRKRGRDT